MDYLLRTLVSAWGLLTAFDPEVYAIVWTSLKVSLTSAVFASLLGVPAGVALALGRFRGRRFVLLLLNTLMALPTVVVGLFMYGLVGRRGPLGELGLLFTPQGIVLGEPLLALPIIVNLTISAVHAMDARLLATCRTLGGRRRDEAWMVVREGRYGIMAAIVAGFGRVVGEVGVAMMLGGNIRNSTRTMTTAIALETSKGEFAFGLALGMILLGVALLVNLGLNLLQQR